MSRRVPYSRHRNPEKGQTLVEYVLVLIVAITVASLVKNLTSRSIERVWFRLAGIVAAPCAECDPPEAIPTQD